MCACSLPKRKVPDDECISIQVGGVRVTTFRRHQPYKSWFGCSFFTRDTKRRNHWNQRAFCILAGKQLHYRASKIFQQTVAYHFLCFSIFRPYGLVSKPDAMAFFSFDSFSAKRRRSSAPSSSESDSPKAKCLGLVIEYDSQNGIILCYHKILIHKIMLYINILYFMLFLSFMLYYIMIHNISLFISLSFHPYSWLVNL